MGLALGLPAHPALVRTAGSVYCRPCHNASFPFWFDFSGAAGHSRWSRSGETRSFRTRRSYGAQARYISEAMAKGHCPSPGARGAGMLALDPGQLRQQQVKAALSPAPATCGSAQGQSPDRVTSGKSFAVLARVAPWYAC